MFARVIASFRICMPLLVIGLLFVNTLPVAAQFKTLNPPPKPPQMNELLKRFQANHSPYTQQQTTRHQFPSWQNDQPIRTAQLLPQDDFRNRILSEDAQGIRTANANSGTFGNTNPNFGNGEANLANREAGFGGGSEASMGESKSVLADWLNQDEPDTQSPNPETSLQAPNQVRKNTNQNSDPYLIDQSFQNNNLIRNLPADSPNQVRSNHAVSDLPPEPALVWQNNRQQQSPVVENRLEPFSQEDFAATNRWPETQDNVAPGEQDDIAPGDPGESLSQYLEEPPNPNQFLPPSNSQAFESPSNQQQDKAPIQYAPNAPSEFESTQFQMSGDEQPEVDQGVPVFDKPVWWREQITSRLGMTQSAQAISLDELIYLAVRSSPKILSISQDPLIRETEVVQAQSEFDPELFARTKYDDRTDPVGNLLTTNQPFLETKKWTAAAGLRRKLAAGGSIDIQQELGHENSNSQFFDPQDQGTATLSLNFSQPLLRGRGVLYNRSQIMLAEIGAGIAWDKFQEELQDELLVAYESYWNLYYHRSRLVQIQRNVARGEEVLQRLDARSEFDSIPSQVSRARAAIQQRKTDLANAIRDVKNAETEIRRITAYPDWQNASSIELVPVNPAQGMFFQPELQQVVTTALENRPEVQQVMKRTRAAAVSADISKNELLPELSLIFGTYVSGLEGNSDIPAAVGEQFRNTTPGFYGGLEFSLPYKNRAARSRFEQSRLQLAQIRHEVNRVTQDIIADSQVALRRVDSAYQTSLWAFESMEAAQQDLVQHQKRWESFGLVEGDIVSGLNASTSLNQLLDAQERLAKAELAYSQSIIDFKVAEIALKKATGTLLKQESISIDRGFSEGLPQLQISR